MQCPYCGEADTRVIDSRDFVHGVRRRRQCVKCNARFTTHEELQSRNFFVVKKDGRREEFNRDKLLTGIRKACEKRPLPTGVIDKLVDGIETDIFRLGKAEVPSSVIGDIVMQKLKELDYIAYIRFASVYREFADISELKEEVDTLIRDHPAPTASKQLSLLPDASPAKLRQRIKNRPMTHTRKAKR
ncbi:MAG: transcriptional regulator NrdR [Chloroflexota bacterium]